MRILQWSALWVTLGVLVASACRQQTPPPPQSQPVVGTNAPARPEPDAVPAEGSVPFTGTLTCPIPGKNPGGTATAYSVGPKPCDVSTLGEACRVLMLTEEHCTWTGVTLAGQPLTASVMHGQGYFQGEIGVVTSGYDWGTLPNGDWYLGQWTEHVDLAAGKITAKWKIVQGTGTLKNIRAEAEFTCNTPGPNDQLETCNVSGSSWLPVSK